MAGDPFVSFLDAKAKMRRADAKPRLKAFLSHLAGRLPDEGSASTVIIIVRLLCLDVGRHDTDPASGRPFGPELRSLSGQELRDLMDQTFADIEKFFPAEFAGKVHKAQRGRVL